MHIALVPVIEAGAPLTIDLIAIKNSGFTYDQTISCTDDKGVPINDLEGFLYPKHPSAIGTTLHIPVPIMTIKLSHAGLYLCTTFLETPHQVDNLSDSANFSITVKGQYDSLKITIMLTNYSSLYNYSAISNCVHY